MNDGHAWPPRGIDAARAVADDLARSGEVATFVQVDVVARTGSVDADAWQVADTLAVALGFRAIGRAAWQPCDRATSESLARTLLSRDLAYDQPLLDDARAARLAHRLCGALDRYAARFVASGRVEPGFKQWTPIGDDTFELVLVGFDADVAFLLRASAED